MSNRTAKITALAVSLATLVGLGALAAPAVAQVTEFASNLTAAPTTTTADDDAADTPDGYVDLGEGVSVPEGGPGDCEGRAMINLVKNGNGPWLANLLGKLDDQGARPGANGEAITDEKGVRAYIVAEGDSPIGIAERFCVEYPTVLSFNNVYGAIQPGQELVLRPKPNEVWVPNYPSE